MRHVLPYSNRWKVSILVVLSRLENGFKYLMTLSHFGIYHNRFTTIDGKHIRIKCPKKLAFCFTITKDFFTASYWWLFVTHVISYTIKTDIYFPFHVTLSQNSRLIFCCIPFTFFLNILFFILPWANKIMRKEKKKRSLLGYVTLYDELKINTLILSTSTFWA